MKIAVFGCSWSYGVPSVVDEQHNFYNWPYFLSKKTGWLIENYALGGTCIRWSINNLENFLKEKKDYFIIFQITNPNRFTKNNLKFKYINCRKKLFENYYQYDHEIRNYLTTYQASKINDKLWYERHKLPIEKDIQNMYNSMVRFYPEEYFWNDYKCLLEYIKKNSNLFFKHQKNYQIEDNSIMSIGDQFKSLFDNFIIDNGMHFGIEGLKYQADFIKELIDDRK